MEIVWTVDALTDLEEIERYIAADSPAAAARVKRLIRERIGSLAQAPHQGRPGRVDHTRELVIGGLPYIAAYHVRGERIVILTVLHGARRWPNDL